MLRIHSFLVIIFLFLTIDSYGQYGWLRSYGGSKDEIGKSIVKSGNTYYITGLTNSSDNDFQGLNKGESDIIVLNISEKGKLNWKKTFGGLFRDEGMSISSTIDGGCIISGYTESNNGDFKSMNKGYNDIFIIRLDSLGNLIWKKTFGGISGEIGISITSSPDSCFYVTGGTSSSDGDITQTNYGENDVFIFKINNNGDSIWKRFVGGRGNDQGNSVVSTSDGGCVLTGSSNSNNKNFIDLNKGETDIFVIRYDKNGEIIWKTNIGGSRDEFGSSVSISNDGCYIVGGWSMSNDGEFFDKNKGEQDIVIMKLDTNGKVIWSRDIGGSSFDILFQSLSSFSGQLYFTGLSYSNDLDFKNRNKGNGDIILGKLDLDGNLEWVKNYGGKENDYGYSLSFSNDGGVLLTGISNSSDGDMLGTNIDYQDIFVMKLDSNGILNIPTSINEFSEPTTTLSVHPNPFSNTTTISYKVETPSNIRIELLNTLGQTIEVLRNDYSDSGTYQLPLNVSNLTSGMYSVRMRSGSNSMVVPVWVIK